MSAKLSHLRETCLSSEAKEKQEELDSILREIQASRISIEENFSQLQSIRDIMLEVDFCLKEQKENIARSFAGSITGGNHSPLAQPLVSLMRGAQNWLLGGQRCGIDYRMYEITSILKPPPQKVEPNSSTSQSSDSLIHETDEIEDTEELKLTKKIENFVKDIYIDLCTTEMGSLNDLHLLNRLVKLKEEASILDYTYQALSTSLKSEQSTIFSIIKSDSTQKLLTELDSITTVISQRQGETNDITKIIEKRLQEIKLIPLMTPPPNLSPSKVEDSSENDTEHNSQAISQLRTEGVNPNILQVFIALRGAVVEFKEILQVQNKLDIEGRNKLNEANLRNFQSLQLLIQQTVQFKDKIIGELQGKIKSYEREIEDFKQTATKINTLLQEGVIKIEGGNKIN
jgi:hypothetical protein